MIVLVIVLIVYGVVVTIAIGSAYSDYCEERAAKLDDRSYYENVINQMQKSIDAEREDAKRADKHSVDLLTKNSQLEDSLRLSRESLSAMQRCYVRMRDDMLVVVKEGGLPVE